MRLNLSLGALAALQLAANLTVQLTVLHIVGAGPQTDAFIAAQTVPLVLLAVLSVSLQSAWQPRLAVLAQDARAWLEAQSAAQGQVLLGFGGVALSLALVAPLWVAVLFPGFGADQRSLTLSMTAPLLLSSALSCHGLLLTTALRAVDRFVLAEVVTLAGGVLALLLALVTVPRWGVEAAAWVALVRSALVTMVLYVLAQRPGVSLRLALDAGAVWKQLKPLVAGSSLYKTAPLVDRYWSSLAPAGGLTAYGFVQLGMGAVSTIMERAINVPVAPQLARMVDRREFEGVRHTYRRSVRRIGFATILAGAALVASHPVWPAAITTVVPLPVEWVRQSWWIALLLLGYLWVSAAGTIVVAAFVALGDARTPVRVGVISFMIGVALKSGGYMVAGLPGLAAATSVYYIGNMFILSLLLERKLNAQLP